MNVQITQSRKKSLTAGFAANRNRPLPPLRKSRPFRRSGVDRVFAKIRYAKAAPSAHRTKRSHITLYIILLFKSDVNTHLKKGDPTLIDKRPYKSKSKSNADTPPPKTAPNKKSSRQMRPDLRLERPEIPLSSKMRFASLSISAHDDLPPPISRRKTKYASSKYRLSPVRTTIIRFCAPFNICPPLFNSSFLAT